MMLYYWPLSRYGLSKMASVIEEFSFISLLSDRSRLLCSLLGCGLPSCKNWLELMSWNNEECTVDFSFHRLVPFFFFWFLYFPLVYAHPCTEILKTTFPPSAIGGRLPKRRFSLCCHLWSTCRINFYCFISSDSYAVSGEMLCLL